MQFIKPTEGLVTSFFSPQRKNPVTGILKPHTGADIGWYGTDDKVVAMASGKVVVPKYSNLAGNYVYIEHGNGFTTVYSHLKSISVKNGQQIKQGQTLGIKGSTGNSTGNHLHFEVIEHHTYSNDWGKKRNPLLYFSDPTTKQWQGWLKELGFYNGTVDGIYGDSTIKAVLDYQKKFKLGVDGVCGRATYNHIKSAHTKLDKKPTQSSPIPPKGVEEDLKFTSATLEKELEKLIGNATSRKQIIERAIKELGYNESWRTKKAEDGDILSMALSLAVKCTKEHK